VSAGWRGEIKADCIGVEAGDARDFDRVRFGAVEDRNHAERRIARDRSLLDGVDETVAVEVADGGEECRHAAARRSSGGRGLGDVRAIRRARN
jgi:hypothetical protein